MFLQFFIFKKYLYMFLLKLYDFKLDKKWHQSNLISINHNFFFLKMIEKKIMKFYKKYFIFNYVMLEKGIFFLKKYLHKAQKLNQQLDKSLHVTTVLIVQRELLLIIYSYTIFIRFKSLFYVVRF